MPTYQYHCTNEWCNNEWEAFHGMKDEDVVKICPQCQQESAKRDISKTNFVLAGSGWSKDNYSGSSNHK